MSDEHPLIAIEREALRRWCSGDPSGYLEISAPEVTYFDPFRVRRLDGLDALTALYGTLRGQIDSPRFELLNPRVQDHGDTAVLSFNFVSWERDGGVSRWNCTEVYVRVPGAHRIVHTHWSFTAAEDPIAG